MAALSFIFFSLPCSMLSYPFPILKKKKKLPFSTFGLRYAPFNSDSRLFEVRWVSSVPSPTVAAQPLYMLGEYFPKTSYQYSSRFAFSKIPSPPLLVVLDSHHPTIHTYIYIYKPSPIIFYMHHLASCNLIVGLLLLSSSSSSSFW